MPISAATSNPVIPSPRTKQHWHCATATLPRGLENGSFRTRAVGARGRKRRATGRWMEVDGDPARGHTSNKDKLLGDRALARTCTGITTAF